MSKLLLSKIEACWCDSILLSDHAPISLTIQILNIFLSPPPLRFQAKWFQSPEFVEFLNEKIHEYFSINTNQIIASVGWQAFKDIRTGVVP